MEQEIHRVKLTICGKELTIQTAESAEHVIALAKKLEGEIARITHYGTTTSTLSAALVVALGALDDLEKANQNLDEMREEMKEYVDEAGKLRLERDGARAELAALRQEKDTETIK